MSAALRPMAGRQSPPAVRFGRLLEINSRVEILADAADVVSGRLFFIVRGIGEKCPFGVWADEIELEPK